MKKMIALAALAALTGMSQTTLAAEKPASWYAGFSLGSTKFEVGNGSDNKTGAAAYLGYAFNPHVAVEIAAQGLGHWDEDGTKITATSVNASLLGKLPVGDSASLFVRAGWARNTLQVENGYSVYFHDNPALFGLGADFGIGHRMSIRAEYLNLGKNRISDGYDGFDIKIHQFNLGMNFKF